jgi:hypothetical protein
MTFSIWNIMCLYNLSFLVPFVDLSNIILDNILYYIPPQIYIFFLHWQCLEFYLKQSIMLLELTIFCEDTIIIERFYSLGLLQKFLQLFIKGHLLLQISIHLCMHVVNLPLYVIFGLIYITNFHSSSSNSFYCFKRVYSIFL